jgi:hypothetical protein
MLPSMFSGNNAVGVFLAAAANLTLGFFWYSPGVFGRPWSKLIRHPAKKSSRLWTYFFPLFSALVEAMFLLELMLVFKIDHTLDGAVLGAFVGVGFVMAAGAVQDFLENRPLPLFLINYGYHFLGLMLTGAVLGAWL